MDLKHSVAVNSVWRIVKSLSRYGLVHPPCPESLSLHQRFHLADDFLLHAGIRTGVGRAAVLARIPS